MKQKGKLVRWNENRGFGFIKSPAIKGDLFIHISELKKMSRRPKVNDIIYFDHVTDDTGKKKAINARIEGVEEVIYRPRKKSKGRSFTSKLISLLIFGGLAFAVYATYPYWSQMFVKSLPVGFIDEDFTGYRCEGKKYCSEMTSCKEARFYLMNCPNVQIDGDNDGIPCESQWCN
ncbi:putative cold shock domain family protein [Desulforapulum autotrophicum HRM2]|uniref:Cold shock domain family protein n=1 Tax=Desulforapulum autotrophicum (strain ATCC 43914 / DSM 3382 / VKM B-1955 / HRM2) TaxID=177437 RepID=C0QEL0_DESAH|nr:excalibur calcium-binding domain-containing protein [Desulforapulum autotrophicum]ACN15352.1 putative cold shock domain family protein [Desulforapulum autotrophicum HRM2]